MESSPSVDFASLPGLFVQAFVAWIFLAVFAVVRSRERANAPPAFSTAASPSLRRSP
jgi:hypothetical protein